MAKLIIDLDRLSDEATKVIDRVVDIPLTPDAAEYPLIKQGVTLVLMGLARAADAALPGNFLSVE
jgi:hypothetical protein